MTVHPDARIAYTIPEAALAVGVSQDTIRVWISEGRLTPRRAGRTGRRPLILADELRAAVAALPTERPGA